MKLRQNNFPIFFSGQFNFHSPTFVQGLVFTGQPLPDTMEELVDRITAAHNMIDRNELVRAVKNMKKRAKKCVAVQGGPFEGKLIRTN